MRGRKRHRKKQRQKLGKLLWYLGSIIQSLERPRRLYWYGTCGFKLLWHFSGGQDLGNRVVTISEVGADSCPECEAIDLEDLEGEGEGANLEITVVPEE